MSLIRQSFFPRSMFDMDDWFRAPTNLGFGPSTLDMFDPFDELDRMMSRNLMWLNKPAFMDFDQPRVPQKYRVSLDCRGFNAESIKTNVKDGKLIITGSEGSRQQQNNNGDYSVREFKKTYNLPENVETDKLVSFMTSNGQLVVEIPLTPTEEERRQRESASSSMLSPVSGGLNLPQIVDGQNGQKNVLVSLQLPKDLDPSKISVTCKDRDVIVKAEDKVDKPDGYSRTYYYQRTTFPENTDFDQLKCIFDNNKLKIQAPLHVNYELRDAGKRVPIEYNNNGSQTKHD